MNRYLKAVLKFVGVFAGTFAVLVLALFLVFALPIDGAVEKNAGKSVTSKFKVHDTADRGNLDNFTNDVFVLGIMRSSKSEHPIFSAINAPNHPVDYSRYGGNLRELAKNQDVGESYGHYWHGWAVYMRPLMGLFTYQTIQVIMGIVFWALFALIAWWCYRRKMLIVAGALLATFLIMSIETLYLSVTFFSVTLLTLILCLYMLIKFKDEGFLKKASFIFLIAGMTTAFVDMLTFPIMTYVLPAILMFCIVGREISEMSWGKSLLLLVKTGAAWVVGYLGFMVSKWVVFGSLIGAQRLQEGTGHIVKYTEQSRVFKPVLDLFRFAFGESGGVIMIAVLVIIAGFIVFSVIEKKPQVLAISLIGLVPFAWIVVTQSHTAIHPWITYKDVAFSVMALANLQLIIYN